MSGGAIFFILITCCFVLGTLTASFILWSRDKEEISKERSQVQSQGNNRNSKVEGEEGLSGSNSPGKNSRSSGSSTGSKKKKKKRIETCSDKFIRAFAIQVNMKLLFTRRAPSEDSNFEFLNGIRCLTLMFIILGNTYFYILKGPLQNLVVL